MVIMNFADMLQCLRLSSFIVLLFYTYVVTEILTCMLELEQWYIT